MPLIQACSSNQLFLSKTESSLTKEAKLVVADAANSRREKRVVVFLWVCGLLFQFVLCLKCCIDCRHDIIIIIIIIGILIIVCCSFPLFPHLLVFCFCFYKEILYHIAPVRLSFVTMVLLVGCDLFFFSVFLFKLTLRMKPMLTSHSNDSVLKKEIVLYSVIPGF